MRGYFNRPEENAEAFRDGWFHTGDLARSDDEGYLYIIDRKKDMVLTGGYNVYCKEVEQALAQHPDVADAAVVGCPIPCTARRSRRSSSCAAGPSSPPRQSGRTAPTCSQVIRSRA